MSANVLRAINTCHRKLAILEDIVEASKQASATSNRTEKTIRSFKLACKKMDIQEFEKQVYDAMDILSLPMVANLT